MFEDPSHWWIAGLFIAAGIVQFFEEGPGWLVLKWLGRICIGLLMIPLALLAWHMAAAIPVSIAIIVGAVIVVIGMRSSTGRMRRLMVPTRRADRALAPTERERPDRFYSRSD
jgi:hypothetical protein